MTDAQAKIGDLIVALYKDKLTYGEFAKQRFQMIYDAMAAERQFRQAALLQDHDAQLQEKQLAAEQFQNKMLAFSTYLNSVNARQPLTVKVQGDITVRHF